MTEHDRAPADVIHVTLSVLFVVLLVGSTFWLLSPFLTSILWAIIVCVATWPILLRLESLLAGRRRLAVAIITVTILCIVFVPVTLALLTIVQHAWNITTEIRSFESIALPSPPAWLTRIPFGGERLTAEWARFAGLDPEQRATALTPYAQRALQWFAEQAGSVGLMLLQFVLTTIISALALAKGEMVRDAILRFAERLAGRQGHEAALLAARTIRAVVLGVVGTALVQAAIAGAGLFISGVPAAALLTAVTLFLCLAQLGPLPVLIPAIIWLFWSGQTLPGSMLLVLAVIAGALDNVVRPLLIRRGADLPLVLIFAGVLGGLIAFGIIGLFIGPVVLTVAYTLLASWVRAPPAGPAVANRPGDISTTSNA
ncbi:MAG TPA: AI-2E family transporter YdiK [Vicinamibacterales bacterium]|nr:AI-2E family transporter YdiK [Vicinamibacterales bacterium]